MDVNGNREARKVTDGRKVTHRKQINNMAHINPTSAVIILSTDIFIKHYKRQIFMC